MSQVSVVLVSAMTTRFSGWDLVSVLSSAPVSTASLHKLHKRLTKPAVSLRGRERERKGIEREGGRESTNRL